MITNAIEFVRFIRLCCFAYFKAKEHGTHYAALASRHGVPTLCCFVGIGRDAWRVTQKAIEDLER